MNDRPPGTPRLLRAINDRSALELLLERGPLTRSQLSALTGLSKPTASHLLGRLETQGLVQAVGAREGGRGPNARLYAVVPSCAYVVGVYAGPSELKAEVADLAGTVVGTASVPVGDGADPVSLVHGAVASATAHTGFSSDRLRRVVIGTPGLVDPETGDIRFAWDLPRWHQGLLAALRSDLGTPVAFENDVNLAAVAERHLGVARDREDFALIWVGRGLGLAVVIGGRVHHGVTGGAGEIGYLPVPGAPVARLRPGAKVYPGGFQSLVNASAVRDLAAAHGIVASSAADALLAARGDPGAVARLGLGAAGRADPGAAARLDRGAGRVLLDELADRLALGVAAVCTVIDPGVVVLAGEVGRAGGEPLAARVAAAVTAISPLRPELRVSTVDGEPALRGAVLSALAAVRDEVFNSTTA